jgi:hypothetical protein
MLKELNIPEECELGVQQAIKEEKHRYDMEKALEKALAFVKQNPDLKKEQLIQYQTEINASFNSSIEFIDSIASNETNRIGMSRF